MSANLKKQLAEEYYKCAISAKYFLRKYVKITHPQQGRIPFDLYDFQEDVLDQLQKERYNIVLKARQLGISTLTAGYALWLMIFHNDKSVLVIATKQDTAKNIVTSVRNMYKSLPNWLMIGCVENNKLSLRLENGSFIKATSAAGDSGRSEALSLLILDEAAFIQNAEELWTSSSQTLATGGQAIIISTPNGVGNWYHKTWVESKNPDNQWNRIFIKWDEHPDRDQAWYDAQVALLGPKKAAQELDGDFLASGRTVVESDVLIWYKEHMVDDNFRFEGREGGLWIWKEPDYQTDYVIVADVARGDGEDYDAFHIFATEDLEQVAEYRGQLTTAEYGAFLASVGIKYNNALIIVERNNVGWAVIQKLVDLDYGNLFYSSSDLKYIDVHRQFTNKPRSEEKKLLPGFETVGGIRDLMISKLDLYIRQKAVKIKSSRLIDELFTFIWVSTGIRSRAQAQKGYNDDLVMALAIYLWTRDLHLRLITEREHLAMASLRGMTATGYSSIYTGNDTTNDPFKMRYGNGEVFDLRELLGGQYTNNR